jgi:hypothetical protein
MKRELDISKGGLNVKRVIFSTLYFVYICDIHNVDGIPEYRGGLIALGSVIMFIHWVAGEKKKNTQREEK